MEMIIDETLDDDLTDYSKDTGIPCCPKCGSKAYISRDIVDGFYFGWSVGCPRFCHNDGIHGTDFDTPEEECYSIHGLDSKEECIEKWRERVAFLKEKCRGDSHEKEK